MPLFIDVHELDDFPSTEEIKKAHLVDISLQDRYEVRFISYYINRDARKVFCVVEGPDKESCIAVHKQGHGLMACNIVEVEGHYYDVILGRQHISKDGVHLKEDGSMDPGIRTMMLVSVMEPASKFRKNSSRLSAEHHGPSNGWRQIPALYGGTVIPVGRNDTICVFSSSHKAIDCGIAIRKHMALYDDGPGNREDRFKPVIVLHAGDPVTRSGELFEDVIRLMGRLTYLGNPGNIVITSGVSESIQHTFDLAKYAITVTSIEEEWFINGLMDIIEKNLESEQFNVGDLCDQFGISRAQLYRKINQLFCMPPNQLITEIKLRAAIHLIDKGYGNISEIAYQVGYSNPSYFSKCFRERFGVLPSKYRAFHTT